MWLLLAGLAAVAFGLRGILYQWSAKQPMSRNAMLFGVYVSGLLITLCAGFAFGQTWSAGVWVGAAMGAMSYLGNASMYKGYATGKASIVAILVGMPPVLVVLGAFLFWGEKLTPVQTAAFAVLIAGALLIRASNDLSLSNLQGAGWGAAAMFCFACTDLLSKQATRTGADSLPTLTVMFATGALLFGLTWLADRKSSRDARPDESARDEAAAGRRWTTSRTLLWGLVVGLTNCTGMILVMPAFKLGVTGLVSAIIAMNALIVVLYARVVLKEPFHRLETVGIVCSLAGVFVLQLAG
ncbi:EamA family transporter [Paenibacillus thermoaerophilus]|uniref:EamA family transporter n=1 Tax=Paenibacillus thermoaerophilus TaxID=1215385 RepID=A0ABW2V5F3_9BACL|nr:DMT family transporter [Paenibacillus thermoaerophilus]TMV11974.1 EamA family transporter [Paenibacillus thermoaerophilus]